MSKFELDSEKAFRVEPLPRLLPFAMATMYLASAPFAFILLYSIEELMRDNHRMMCSHEDLFAGIM